MARRLEFQNLAKNLAMQIAAGNLIYYIRLEDIPETIWKKETEIENSREDVLTKPETIRNSIVKGRVEKTLKGYTLVDQLCIRDPDITVDDYIKNHIALLGENIKVNRFQKFVIGQPDKLSTVN